MFCKSTLTKVLAISFSFYYLKSVRKQYVCCDSIYVYKCVQCDTAILMPIAYVKSQQHLPFFVLLPFANVMGIFKYLSLKLYFQSSLYFMLADKMWTNKERTSHRPSIEFDFNSILFESFR